MIFIAVSTLNFKQVNNIILKIIILNRLSIKYPSKSRKSINFIDDKHTDNFY